MANQNLLKIKEDYYLSATLPYEPKNYTLEIKNLKYIGIAGIIEEGSLKKDFVVTENFADFYNLPVEVLNKMREIVCSPLGIELNGGSNISMFLYDNDTFVVESFNDVAVEVEVLLSNEPGSVTDILTQKQIEKSIVPPARNQRGRGVPWKYGYKVMLPPHSFRVFKIDNM